MSVLYHKGFITPQYLCQLVLSDIALEFTSAEKMWFECPLF